jgi:hypothetical protein
MLHMATCSRAEPNLRCPRTRLRASSYEDSWCSFHHGLLLLLLGRWTNQPACVGCCTSGNNCSCRCPPGCCREGMGMSKGYANRYAMLHVPLPGPPLHQLSDVPGVTYAECCSSFPSTRLSYSHQGGRQPLACQAQLSLLETASRVLLLLLLLAAAAPEIPKTSSVHITMRSSNSCPTTAIDGVLPCLAQQRLADFNTVPVHRPAHAGQTATHINKRRAWYKGLLAAGPDIREPASWPKNCRSTHKEHRMEASCAPRHATGCGATHAGLAVPRGRHFRGTH